MKTSWDKLMRYAPEREYPLAPLQPDEAARIVEQTMQKAGIKTKKTARPIRAAALAAAIAALLCVSALAAFQLGWFDRLFGGSAAKQPVEPAKLVRPAVWRLCRAGGEQGNGLRRDGAI